MKVQGSIPNNENIPSFKSAAWALSNAGNLMQQIENGGFLASFLIQDGLGMTLPRTCAGFMRDKEVTGHYNKQEGLEVLGREGLTGPCMMAVAPIGLFIAAKFGRSTSINSRLIKHFGNTLKNFISSPGFDKTLLNKPEEFKQIFYKKNIKNILENTLGKENTKQESIDYILEQIANYEKIPSNAKLERFRGKSKYRKRCIENITEHINNIKLSTGTDLEVLRKVRLGDDKKAFGTKEAVEGLIKYSDDAITANKHLDKLDAIQAESLKNKSLAKRLITTVSLIASTLGILSVLPKIYAPNDTAPGAKTKKAGVQNQNINFKGKAKESILEKLGKLISKNKSDFVSSELEYNGHNFTNTLMAGLSLFGLLIPRGLRAYSRAETKEDGKKDLTELWEICLRDIPSSLAVVFAVPMGTRACVSAYEKNSGFVLLHKDRSQTGKLKSILDLLNPYSKTHVLTNAEISALYDNITTREKMLNFCKYIDKNGGDLHKIISKSDNAENLLNNSELKFNTIKKLSKPEKNKKIIEFFEKCNISNETIQKLMKGAGNLKKNKIAAFARGLNSVPGLITTFFISPYILGWVIPRLTYQNTRRIHAKEAQEAKSKPELNTNA